MLWVMKVVLVLSVIESGLKGVLSELMGDDLVCLLILFVGEYCFFVRL